MSRLLASSKDEYIEQMKTVYAIDTGTVESVDWLLVIGGAAVTFVSIAALIYWISKIILRLYAVRRGKAALADGLFWKRMTIGIVLILFLIGGTWLVLLEQFFSLMRQWGWK
ncbi:hypothetical protein DFQ01_11096 [Paenibacillus cellulosilyticus]|uniref:Uncharacterized protein n=1 Tax=Paenibacillus cellulosilyticus TaxID=375489 RepID=A0A2V2YTP3_9BACL|nr:hypothetical protein [Paenibacillus cellulosilyticus]PWW01206.1 hypothetical protein DFQ01_11096 [Paenibacillus cellulosilyticus]QKS46839.1 hypothetical protein HUB94_20360 [Paenibacillus cellulosilyticus]